MGDRSHVCVIGAGVVGLSTAVCVQTLLPGVKVTLVADRFAEQTTSDGAAGIFVPTLERVPGVPKEKLKRWCMDSFDHFHRLAQSQDAPWTGCLPISGYNLYRNEPQEPFYRDIVYSCTPLTSEELDRFGCGHRYGYLVRTLLIECRRYLPWLMERFRENGGDVVKRRVSDLNQVAECGAYHVVVNCSGLGSRDLVPDSQVYPLRGQVLRVKAPWVKMFYRDLDTLASIIPGAENVLLAGTRQLEDETLEVRADDRRAILARCHDLLPQLQGASMEREWVGLRPCRTPGLRVEPNTTPGGGRVVHNYGHGGVGVALSWGTGLEAARLVQRALYPGERGHPTRGHKAKL